MHYIFVDYENVQPRNLEPLIDIPCTIYLFIGAKQPKLPVQLATEMQKLGERAKYIQISSSEKDALDFHIAYYIGEISANDKDGHFHILSNDKGFDPLIEHLRGRNIKAERVGIRARKNTTSKAPKPGQTVKSVHKATTAKPVINTTFKEKAATIITYLSKCGKAKPAKIETLRNTVASLFQKELPQNEISNLINHLKQKKYISIDEKTAKISYKLPKTPQKLKPSSTAQAA